MLFIVFRSCLSWSLSSKTDQREPNMIPKIAMKQAYTKNIVRKKMINYGSIIFSTSQFSMVNLLAICLSVDREIRTINPLNIAHTRKNVRTLSTKK